MQLSEFRTILHNLFARMNQSGAFDKEVSGEGSETDLLNQFLWEDADKLLEQGLEIIANNALMYDDHDAPHCHALGFGDVYRPLEACMSNMRVVPCLVTYKGEHRAIWI